MSFGGKDGLSKDERSIPLRRVQDILISQHAWGRLLDYGDILIESAGGDGTEIVVRDIAGPDVIKDAIMQQFS